MRVQGWERLLNDHIDTARTSTFQWGQNDCALWCADWVLKATKQDFASKWRGRYESEEELLELLASEGITQYAELPEFEGMQQHQMVSFAQRGDIVEMEQGCLGICNGIDSFFLMERGITRLRTQSCIRAWKVK